MRTKSPFFCNAVTATVVRREAGDLLRAETSDGLDVTVWTAELLCLLADILERAEEVRSDTLNGVVNYILNGGGHMGEATKNSVMRDFDRLRNLVDEKVALGAVAFQVMAGRWSASLDRSPTTYETKLTFRRAAYRRAGQYLAEGMTHFTVIEGPWTVSLKEPS